MSRQDAMRSAQISYDNACDCCGHDHVDEPKANPMVPSWELRKALRKAKGRPEFGRTLYTQWDATTKRLTAPSVVEDPILNLFVLRLNTAHGYEGAAANYRKTRARAMCYSSGLALADMLAAASICGNLSDRAIVYFRRPT